MMKILKIVFSWIIMSLSVFGMCWGFIGQNPWYQVAVGIVGAATGFGFFIGYVIMLANFMNQRINFN